MIKAFCGEIIDDHEALAPGTGFLQRPSILFQRRARRCAENLFAGKERCGNDCTVGNGANARYPGIDGFDNSERTIEQQMRSGAAI